mmetsp:Transcript_137843/g.251104  ORF Transcript_137843/g.251104 Transcript_137843/m.251104 type:complete len:251 (-) Transcript_137843:1571-2323(-)
MVTIPTGGLLMRLFLFESLLHFLLKAASAFLLCRFVVLRATCRWHYCFCLFFAIPASALILLGLTLCRSVVSQWSFDLFFAVPARRLLLRILALGLSLHWSFGLLAVQIGRPLSCSLAFSLLCCLLCNGLLFCDFPLSCLGCCLLLCGFLGKSFSFCLLLRSFSLSCLGGFLGSSFGFCLLLGCFPLSCLGSRLLLGGLLGSSFGSYLLLRCFPLSRLSCRLLLSGLLGSSFGFCFLLCCLFGCFLVSSC